MKKQRTPSARCKPCNLFHCCCTDGCVLKKCCKCCQCAGCCSIFSYGAVGPEGPPGPPGRQGPQGIQGPRGERGLPGKPFSGLIMVETFQYTAVSDGYSRVYTNQDALPQFASSTILNPLEVSYINLFINGMIQPQQLFIIEEGSLTFTDNAIPESGVPIILQFIRIYAQ